METTPMNKSFTYKGTTYRVDVAQEACDIWGDVAGIIYDADPSVEYGKITEVAQHITESLIGQHAVT